MLGSLLCLLLLLFRFSDYLKDEFGSCIAIDTFNSDHVMKTLTLVSVLPGVLLLQGTSEAAD